MNKNDFFPQSNLAGSVTSLNTELMREISESSPPITLEKFRQMHNEHLMFLENGGKGGKWQTFEVSGLTLASYFGPNPEKGKQASFLNCNLSSLNLSEIDLECCDFVNAFSPGGSFRNSSLKNCIFIDSVLDNADFTGADLSESDFSRAQMKSCKFNNANLSGCDFENCDLSGSDFTGSNTKGARFPGAILSNVIF
jgi:uncharacterized protein YjbI with pentapeptide repeats